MKTRPPHAIGRSSAIVAVKSEPRCSANCDRFSEDFFFAAMMENGGGAAAAKSEACRLMTKIFGKNGD